MSMPDPNEWAKLDALWTASSVKRCLQSSVLANKRYQSLQNRTTLYAKALRRQAVLWAMCADLFQKAEAEIKAAGNESARVVPVLEGPTIAERLR